MAEKDSSRTTKARDDVGILRKFTAQQSPGASSRLHLIVRGDVLLLLISTVSRQVGYTRLSPALGCRVVGFVQYPLSAPHPAPSQWPEHLGLLR